MALAASCAALPGGVGLFRTVLASTDCLIAGQVEQAYTALLAPSGAFVAATTIVLTLYVAIVGYRLVLGTVSLTLAELVPHFVRIGIVLALVTGWPAYQAVVFDLLFDGSEQVAGMIGGNSATRPGATVIGGVEQVYDRIADAGRTAWTQHPVAASAATSVDPARPAPAGIMPAGLQLGAPQFASMLLWLAAATIAFATVGMLLVTRILLALLLLVGPAFIVAGLFPATRGLCEGWLRVAVRNALTPLFIILASAGLVTTLDPFVAAVEADPTQPAMTAVLAIVLIVAVFAAVLLQAMKLSGAIAGGIRLLRPASPAPVPPREAVVQALATIAAAPSRAMTIVEAIPGYRAPRPAPDAVAPDTLVVGGRRIVLGDTAGAAAVDFGSRLGQRDRRSAVVAARRIPAR